MSRPTKNNCDYFPHDKDMRNHVKIKAIRNKFKNGYAIWVMFLEYLTGADGNVFEYSELQFELLSGDFGFDSTEIKDVIDYAIKIEIIFNKNGFINSDSLDERLEPVYTKRGKSKEQSAKQQRINGKFTNNNTVSTIVSVTEIPQSKVKENKENKKEKENIRKDKEKMNKKESDEDSISSEFKNKNITSALSNSTKIARKGLTELAECDTAVKFWATINNLISDYECENAEDMLDVILELSEYDEDVIENYKKAIYGKANIF